VRRPSAQAQIFVCTNTSWLKFYSVLIYKCAELYTAEILASWDELLFPLIGLEHEYSTRAGKGDFLVKASLDCWASWSSILQRTRGLPATIVIDLWKWKDFHCPLLTKET
jgi:hypothetical protein